MRLAVLLGPVAVAVALAAGTLGGALAAEPAPVARSRSVAPPGLTQPPSAGPSAHVSPSQPVVESPVVVTARVTPDPSSIGDVLSYEVTAAFGRGISVNLPSMLRFDPLHLVGVKEAAPEPTGVGFRKVFTIELQRFAVEQAEIPEFSLTYVDAEGQVQTVRVPAHSFAVEALLANEVDPVRRGEDPPVSNEYANERAELIVYSVGAGLLLALVALVLWRRVAARKKPVYVPPPIPPHELALGALDELQHGSLLDQGEFVDYYLQLTEIAKGYLQGRFGVGALDRTTEEIRRELMAKPEAIAPLSVDEMVSFLQRCDLVKFARLKPAAAEAEEQTEGVRAIVQRTIPTPTKKPVASRPRSGQEGTTLGDEAVPTPAQPQPEEAHDERGEPPRPQPGEQLAPPEDPQ